MQGSLWQKLSLSYEGTDATVLTDEKWLGFVIGQILSNALKYTRTGGIEIWLEDERGNRTSNTAPAILVIADTGIGIQAEDLPRIFEKGYTGVNGREDNRATGIGLYLSRKILKKLGHEITVDSQVDKGTEVRLSLWKKSWICIEIFLQKPTLHKCKLPPQNVSHFDGSRRRIFLY